MPAGALDVRGAARLLRWCTGKGGREEVGRYVEMEGGGGRGWAAAPFIGLVFAAELQRRTGDSVELIKHFDSNRNSE